MNPEQNRSTLTVQTLMLIELFIAAGVPVIAIAFLDVLFQLKLDNFFLYVIGFAIIVLILVLLPVHLVQRKIRDRFTALTDICQDFSGGDRTIRVAVNGDDEFAKLGLAINNLFETQSSLSGGSSFSGAPSGSEAAALQAQIEKLLQEVSAVGDGDLRVQAEVTPDTLGVLADSFNYMIEELAKVVGRVQATAVQVTNATRRILDRSAELAQASDTQVKQIAQTTEAVEALAVFIQNVARNAQMSVEAAQDALHNAASGQQAVRQTIEGMMVIRENVQETAKKIKRLGERSNEIGEIVRIIEDIADQTNLLALNAAIQSAMAGEHGRGFAVVADEIRLLAERSTESTKRIATLVKSIQGDTYEAVVAMEDSTQEVVKGSQLADDAGRSLNSIYGAVERQAQMIESIAHAANEQTTVSEAVAIAMGRISEITRQTDAGTQEAAVSVSYLAELSEQLRASVSTFRLPDRTNDMIGSFSNMTSVSEMSADRGNQSFGSGTDQSWGQGFSNSFPPLPEPGNTGAFIPMTSQAAQFSFNNQMDFGRQAGSDGAQQFGSQPQIPAQSVYSGDQQFGRQQFGNQPQIPAQSAYNGGQQFGNQPQIPAQSAYNSGQLQAQPYFGNNQLDFSELANFESQPGFNQSYSDQQFGATPNFGASSQPFYQSDPGLGKSIPNPAGPVSQPLPSGQGIPSRPRWQNNGSPQDQKR